jgi:2-polyprenyl-3-methyl-5-hydroxy-6-metoxy-1,4-benzoquinol methylase
MNLSEFHSGYRAYSLKALKEIVMDNMTNDFHFDTEIIIKMNHQGFIIKETPIPTYYGDEICHVDGLKYAKNVLRSVLRYNRSVSGTSKSSEYEEYYQHYPSRTERFSSHWWLDKFIGSGNLVLDIGCSTGEFATQLKKQSNTVVGMDILPAKEIGPDIDKYIQMDLNQVPDDLPAILDGQTFDKVIMADILEHLIKPETILQQSRQLLAPKGRLIVSLPNIANITVRLNLLLGRFTYSDRGILDSTHLHFYTLGTAKKLFQENGFQVILHRASNMPVERALGIRRRPRLFSWLLAFATRCFPRLLGFQHVFILEQKEG